MCTVSNLGEVDYLEESKCPPLQLLFLNAVVIQSKAQVLTRLMFLRANSSFHMGWEAAIRKGPHIAKSLSPLNNTHAGWVEPPLLEICSQYNFPN